MSLIDTHCHLDFSVFNKDRDELVEAAKLTGVQKIIVPSVSQSNWLSVMDMKRKYDAVEIAVGLHPMFMHLHQQKDLVDLKQLLSGNHSVIHSPRVSAIGECGLDFSFDDTDKNRQVEYFVEQLKLASEFSLPVIIHARKSLDIVLKYLRRYSQLTGVIHSFSGSYQQALQCINEGFLLGFGGPVTYTRANKLRKLVTELPLESLLLETDAPDQPDSTHQGERNVPANLTTIAVVIAELRQSDLDEISRVTSQNAKQLFNLKAQNETRLKAF